MNKPKAKSEKKHTDTHTTVEREREKERASEISTDFENGILFDAYRKHHINTIIALH